MRELSWIILAMVTSNYCAAQAYSGPKHIGPFYIDRNTPTRVLFRELGVPVQKLHLNCYATSDRRAFMNFESIDSEPENVGDVFVSDFPNCKHTPIQPADTFEKWKTGEGIGLGSSEADVLKAYGKPRSRDKIDTSYYPKISGHIVRGYRRGDKLPNLADHTLFYNGDISTDLSAAEFGIRKGKVAWIWLSQNE